MPNSAGYGFPRAGRISASALSASAHAAIPVREPPDPHDRPPFTGTRSSREPSAAYWRPSPQSIRSAWLSYRCARHRHASATRQSVLGQRVLGILQGRVSQSSRVPDRRQAGLLAGDAAGPFLGDIRTASRSSAVASCRTHLLDQSRIFNSIFQREMWGAPTVRIHSAPRSELGTRFLI
jgi:hypothetical protein